MCLCGFITEFANTAHPHTQPYTHMDVSAKEDRILSGLLIAVSSVLRMHLVLIRHYIIIEHSGILKPRGGLMKIEIPMDTDTSIGRKYYSVIGPRWRSLGGGVYKNSNY